MYQRIQKPSPKKCAKAMKIMNLATGGVIIAFGVVGILFMAIMQVLSGKFFLVFSPLFQIMFGAILIAAQFKVETVMQYFGFLKQFLGRGIFNIYLAASVYYYFSCGSNNYVLAWASSMTLFALGIIYILLHFFAGNYIYSRNLAEELA